LTDLLPNFMLRFSSAHLGKIYMLLIMVWHSIIINFVTFYFSLI